MKPAREKLDKVLASFNDEQLWALRLMLAAERELRVAWTGKPGEQELENAYARVIARERPR